ncbi:MAG: Ig-like domain-containing protein [Pseudonocardiales bacterium]
MTLLAGLAACQRTELRKASATAKPGPSAFPAAHLLPLALAVAPANAARDVPPNLPVVVTAAHGRITSVKLATTKGAVVPGVITPDGAKWTSSGMLSFGTHYSITGQAVDGKNTRKTIASTFTTVTPRRLVYPDVSPLAGETVGVGMPIIITWSRSIPDRAAAERLLEVTTDKPVVGTWSWISSHEVHYRPQVYWPADTHVTVDINVGRADLGDGVYGRTSRRIAFTIGSSVVTTVSNATKTLTVYQNGVPIRTMPVSMGKSSMPTSAGISVVLVKFDQKFFDSASFGVPRDSPDGYYTKVYWDTKFTFGGEYVHAAPWSVSQQGHRNVSHGCINVSTADAKWFYYLSKRGDIVQVIGTERRVRQGDGYTDWNVPWTTYLAGSALH